MALFAGPVLLALILVWLTKRFWVVLVTLPSVTLTLLLLTFPRPPPMTGSYLLAASFVLFAWLCSIRGWRAGRGT
jgi:predicted acyltransferase